MSIGSVVAAALWIAVSLLFSWYLSRFADYNATYGSLGAVIGLMMWLWLSVTIILVGAELNSELEHQTARDSTVGAPKPLGTRGAADKSNAFLNRAVVVRMNASVVPPWRSVAG